MSATLWDWDRSIVEISRSSDLNSRLRTDSNLCAIVDIFLTTSAMFSVRSWERRKLIHQPRHQLTDSVSAVEVTLNRLSHLFLFFDKVGEAPWGLDISFRLHGR